MLSKIWTWILERLFHVTTETRQKDVEDNTKYAFEYERIDDINFNAIFSNKLANYIINDSNVNIEGENARVELLDKTVQSLWKKAKKWTSMSLGYGGLFIVPYVKSGKIYYNLVPQSRVTIDSMDGDLITGATIIAERKEITKSIGNTKTYIRWTNYRVENGNCVIEQKFTDETGKEIPVPDFWKNILIKQAIKGVDRALLGYVKSPINNRKSNDKYGVPICYGCDNTIKEIKDTMKQIAREYKLKENFVGVDVTLFDVNNRLPNNGLFKTFDFGTDGEDKFQIYDPQYRDYTIRLQELFKRLEHEVGTSGGILSEINTQNATATEIRRTMFDTWTIVDDMRSNIEKCMEDFVYACNVLANAYNLSAMGEYELNFDWDYSLLEDSQESFNQLRIAHSDGIIKDEEYRQWMKPDETIEESEKVIKEIKEKNPSIKDILGRNE